MAADAPIGVFDSGLGGLSVLGAATALLPNESFIYFGDNRRAPSGDKPPEVVLRHAEDVTDKLLSLGCKAIVIACNTATSVAAQPLRKQLSLPVIGMEPALKPASLLPGAGRILVLATRLTLSQEKFNRLMARYGRDAVAVPCPGLVELVEAGETEGARVDALLARLLSPYRDEGCKAVVLGCTHYVFLRRSVERVFGSGVPVIDGNAGTARQQQNSNQIRN